MPGVIRVAPRWQERKATTDQAGVKTFRRGWTVETDSDEVGEPEVIDAVVAKDASAALFAKHPKWAPALCRKLDADPYQSAKQWLVIADYSTAPFATPGMGDGSGVSSGGIANPSTPTAGVSNSTPANQRPPTLSITGRQVAEPLEFDAVTGKRVVNTVGDPFDPAEEVFRTNHVFCWRFHRTYQQLAWSSRGDFLDSINSDPFTILGKTYPAFSLRCSEYSLDTVWETGTSGLELFYSLTVVAEFNRRLWKPEILNRGRRRKATVLGVAVALNIVDGAGAPVSDPVPLTEAGAVVPPGGEFWHVKPNGYIPRTWSGTTGLLG